MQTAEKLAVVLESLTIADISESARHSARRCLYDIIACAAAGQSHPAVEAARRFASSWFCAGTASVWFRDSTLSASAAAFVNAYAASILDLDDGHRAAAGHPGAAVIPSVLAAAEYCGASLDDVLLAIVCGYEAGVRVAKSRDPSRLMSVATGRWSAIAVAAAVAKLRNLSAEKMAHAIAIAESCAPNLLAADHSGFMGGDVKEGIPWSVLAGMAAADQAELGLRGYLGSLDNPDIYRSELIGMDVGKELLIETTYFKEFSCCRWTHSAIEAISEMRRAGLDGALVEEVEISTFQRALSLKNHASPPDLIAAQFSLPFVVAVAIVDGEDALKPLSEQTLGRPDIVRVAKKIRMAVDRQLDACFPAQIPARVRVRTPSRSFEKEVRAPLGDPVNPLSDSRLVEKSIKLCSQLRREHQVRRLAAHIFEEEIRVETRTQDSLAPVIEFLR